MTWHSHGVVFHNSSYKSPFSPAVAIHSGLLHLLWQDKQSESLLWATGDRCNSIQSPRPFSTHFDVEATTSPVLLTVRTRLHSIVAEKGLDGQLFHYQLHEGTNSWSQRAGVGIRVTSPLAVAVIDGGKILCVARDARTEPQQLVYVIWHPDLGWSSPKPVNADGEKPGDSYQPTLFTMPNGDVCLLRISASEKLVWLRFSPQDDAWTGNVAEPVPSVIYIGGSCSAVSITNCFHAIATFESVSTEGISVVRYEEGEWKAPEDLKEKTSDAPILIPDPDNCRLACFFLSSEDGALMYSTRSLRPSAADWMSRIADTTGIWELSIPGTHDSAATTQFIPHAYKSLFGQYETQQLTIKQQLEMGIRFLDLRLSLDDGVLQMVHWIMRVKQTFAQVTQWILKFLENNPSETILVSIKNDTNGDQGKFERAVAKAIQSTPQLWFSGEDLPTLGETRGKIVVFRRYEVTQATIGFDISPPRWPRDPVRLVIPVGKAQSLVVIQDNFDFIDKILPLSQVLDAEWKSIELLLEESRKTDLQSDHKLFINFLSASGPPLYFPVVFANGTLYGESGFVAGMNQRLLDRLMRQGVKSGRLGVLLLDYVNYPSEIVHEIINYNKFV